MRSLPLGVTVLLALGAPAPAAARDRVVLAAFKLVGAQRTDPARQTQARVSLMGGLAAADFEVVPQSDLQRALAGASDLQSCDTAACLRRAGELVNARFVVRASLESVGANWLIQIELIDVHDSTTAARADETCDVCNVAEANEKLSNAAATLRDKLQPNRSPAAAPPPPRLPPPRDARLWRTIGIAGVAAGGVSLLAGIVLLALDHTQYGTRLDTPMTHYIIQRYNTLAPGVVLTLAGAAAIGAGSWALWRDHRAHRRILLAPSVAPTGAALVLFGRF